MSYGLRGANGHVYGLGVFNPPDRPVFIDPGYPPDPGIVAQNTANNNAYQVAMAGAQAQNNLDQCKSNAANSNTPAQLAKALSDCAAAYSDAGAYAAATAVTPVSWYSGGGSTAPYSGINQKTGNLVFTSSRGGTALQPGDTWKVQVTGAIPNQMVTAGLRGSVGQTDAGGNFSMSGTASDIGQFQETVLVAGTPVGAYSYSVNPASVQVVAPVPLVPPVAPVAAGPATPPPAAAGTQAVISPPGGAPISSTGLLPAATSTTFSLASIPWWGWAAAAGVAFLAYSQKGGR